MHTTKLSIWAPSALALAALTLAPARADASPWTLPQHDLSVSTELTYATSSYEYLSDGRYLRYPLDGRFTSSALGIGLRYGFTDRLEMSARPSFKLVAYEADTLVRNSAMPYDPGQETTLGDARANTVDFDDVRLGAGDMDLSARYNLHRGYVLVTGEVGTKIPLGYEPPQETFDATGTRNDDVTLGDGQIDLTAALLIGAYVPWTRTFMRADAGFRHRFGSPGDQIVASAKVGQFISDRLIIFGGTRLVETVTEGEVIGTTLNDPAEQDAATFDVALVEANDLTLDRSYVTAEAGVIIKLEAVELQFSWEEVIDGANYSDLTSINLAVVTNFRGATRQDDVAAGTEEVIIEEIPVEEGELIEGEEGVEVIEEVIIEEVPVEEVVPDEEPDEDAPVETESPDTSNDRAPDAESDE